MRRREHVAPVGVAALDAPQQLHRVAAPGGSRRSRRDGPSALAAVEAVPPDDDPLVRPVLLDVVRAGRGNDADALSRGRQPGRDRAEERQRRSREEVRAGRLSRTTSVLPRETTPRAVFALPASTSSAPTMSRTKKAPDESQGLEHPVDRVGEGARPHRLPLLKRKPRRSVNVYVLRSSETEWRAATSGCSGSSRAMPRPGRCRDPAQVASRSDQPAGVTVRAGSTKSRPKSGEKLTRRIPSSRPRALEPAWAIRWPPPRQASRRATDDAPRCLPSTARPRRASLRPLGWVWSMSWVERHPPRFGLRVDRRSSGWHEDSSAGRSHCRLIELPSLPRCQSERRRMSTKAEKVAIGIGAVLVLALGGAAIAPHDRCRRRRGAEPERLGREASRGSCARATRGGEVTGSELDDEKGATYEVEVGGARRLDRGRPARRVVPRSSRSTATRKSKIPTTQASRAGPARAPALSSFSHPAADNGSMRVLVAEDHGERWRRCLRTRPGREGVRRRRLLGRPGGGRPNGRDRVPPRRDRARCELPGSTDSRGVPTRPCERRLVARPDAHGA